MRVNMFDAFDESFVLFLPSAINLANGTGKYMQSTVMLMLFSFWKARFLSRAVRLLVVSVTPKSPSSAYWEERGSLTPYAEVVSYPPPASATSENNAKNDCAVTR